MLTYDYLTKSAYSFMHQGAAIDTIRSAQMLNRQTTVSQDISEVLLNTCAKHKALGFTDGFKFLINEEIFKDEAFRAEAKSKMFEKIPTTDIRTFEQGGHLTLEKSNRALDAVIDIFQRDVRKMENFGSFVKKSALTNYYPGPFHFEIPPPEAPRYGRTLTVIDPLAYQKHWYVYVGVGIATVILLYNVCEPLGQHATEMIMLKYMPPNS